ncbi:hypothetical protein FQN57_002584 [Myotisia sp. PD_48]|nr:hypothetical protein FQN57_002584 [Myotisia sp. PD_48]
MAIVGTEDGPFQSTSNSEGNHFSDNEDSTTDCSSIFGDDNEFPEDNGENDFLEYHPSANQLRQQEEDKGESLYAYYLAKERISREHSEGVATAPKAKN